jgi:DNA-binding transcriptional LysR family regulator
MDGAPMPRTERYKDLQLSQLKSFSLAATLGSFSAAARKQGVAVPTVWEQVRALERHLATDLLRRKGRAVEPTADGRLLLDLLTPHLNGLDSLRRLFQLRRKTVPQTVGLAATANLLTHDLPGPIRAYCSAHPEIRLALRSGTRQEVLNQVDQGDVDLGLTPLADDEPRRSSLAYERLFAMPLSLVTGNRHPLTRVRKPTIADVVAYPLLMGAEGTFDRRVAEQLVREHGLSDEVRIVLEARSLSMMRPYVAAGIGVALAHVGPRVAKLMPELRIRSFDALLKPLPILLVSRRNAHLPEPVERLRVALRMPMSGRGESSRQL